jgi:spore germination protein GerM
MNDEKKIKDLLARLVSMSPEPPPYPEENLMAAPAPRKRYNPVLMFAAGAVVIAAVIVPVVLLMDDEVPIGAGTTTTVPVTSTTTPPASTTIPTETTSTVDATTTSVPAATTWEGIVYLYQTPENSFLGNPALVPVSLELTDLSGEPAEDDYFTEALAALGSELPELEHGLANAVPPDVQINSITGSETDTGHLVEVDMNEAFLDGAGGLLADVTMLNQLIYSVTWSPFLTNPEVLFTVEGQPVEAFGSEGLDLTEPVDRDTFIDDLGLIFLTEPLVALDGEYQVSGRANVFEAALMVRVEDGAGNVVHEEPVMATCGTGCWGDFSVAIPADLIVGGESVVTLFTHSPEDGSMIDVVTVPIPAGDVWAITVG